MIDEALQAWCDENEVGVREEWLEAQDEDGAPTGEMFRVVSLFIERKEGDVIYGQTLTCAENVERIGPEGWALDLQLLQQGLERTIAAAT